MTKNLVMVIAFVVLLLGSIFLIGRTDKSDKAELISLESGVKRGETFFRTYPVRPAVPDVVIKNETGSSLTLGEIIAQNEGQSLLVNFWATWCAPCREEMPGLEALQVVRGNGKFKVIVISVDRGGLQASREFLDEIGIKALDLYYDEKGALAAKMKAVGYPTTVLIDKKGRQFGLLTGSARWNSPSAHALIDRLLSDE